MRRQSRSGPEPDRPVPFQPQPPHRVSRQPLPRLLVAVLGVALARWACAAPADAPQAAASAPATPALALRPSPSLVERLPPQVRAQEPVFVQADEVGMQPDIWLDARGAVQLRRHSVVFKADALHDDLITDQVHAQGDVRIVQDGNLFSGPELDFNLDTETGRMPDAKYFFNRTQGAGQAKTVEFLGRDHLQADQATYTTCTANPVDWVLQATHLDLDFASDTGVARDGEVRFKGVPILPLPYASFPLSDARKSGLLPPTIGLDSKNGLDWAQPYYWNIAPNYDATLTPRLLLRRGLMGSAAVRWLQPSYQGNAIFDLLPDDRGAGGASRWAAVFQQNGSLASNLSYGLNLQRVSDNNWWLDFGSVDPVINSNRILPQQGQVTWSQPNGSLQASFNTWQTLQSAVSPVAIPYDVRHQLLGNWHSSNYTGLQWQLSAATARFTNSTPGLLSGDRSYVAPAISRPFVAPQGFITPTLRFNATDYATDTLMSNGSSSATRVIPSFSLDSGLVFERSTHTFGHDLMQTLEPRLYYLYTPYRN
ncbi:MAG: LPS-assembly protein LptD, partial [Betaproteobacteria bacterium]|nr:LPS-assembly protein LptD [Betaproteobacteria bacterium]